MMADYALSEAEAEKARKKNSSGFTKHENQIKCSCEELTHVNMIGIILRTETHGSIVRCLHCPAIIKISREWLLLEHVPFAEFVCPSCRPTMSVPAAAEDNGGQRRTEKYFDRQVPATAICCICAKQTRPRHASKCFIIDDCGIYNTTAEESSKKSMGATVLPRLEDADCTIRFAFFCKEHEPLCHYAQRCHRNQLVRLSTLRMLVKHQIDSGIMRQLEEKREMAANLAAQRAEHPEEDETEGGGRKRRHKTSYVTDGVKITGSYVLYGPKFNSYLSRLNKASANLGQNH